MTNQKDKHLNAWLDSYTVDLSQTRLSRLEAAIMDEIETLQIDLFTLPTWREGLGSFSVAGLMAVALLMVSSLINPVQTGDYSTLVLGGSYFGWGQ